jgi:hypothetical protein
MTRMPVHRRDFFGDLGNQSENSERRQSSHERVSGEPSHGVGLVFPILRTLYGRTRYPLCGGCRSRPMQPMKTRQLTPKGLRCNGTGGLYGWDVGILYGPGIAGVAFRLLYRKSGGLVTSIGP